MLASVLAAGCHTARTARALTPELAGNEPDAQMEFWHTLSSRSVTSNDEAFHALLLFAREADPAGDYAGRVAAMRERKMLPADFNRPAEEAVQRGTVAVALARTLEIKGGVVMHVLGPTPRYATRELVSLNLFPPSSPQQTFSGPQFLGIMGRAEDYQRLASAKSRAKNLSDEIRDEAHRK